MGAWNEIPFYGKAWGRRHSREREQLKHRQRGEDMHKIFIGEARTQAANVERIEVGRGKTR